MINLVLGTAIKVGTTGDTISVNKLLVLFSPLPFPLLLI